MNKVIEPYLSKVVSILIEKHGFNKLDAALYAIELPGINELHDSINQKLSASEKKLVELFGTPASNIESLSTEAHFDGEVVSKVKLSSGLSYVVYQGDRSFPSLFSSFQSNIFSDLGLNKPRPVILSRKEEVMYREYIAEERINNTLKAAIYSGATLAVAQVLACTDFHADNVIYSSDIPLVFDEETTLQPVRKNQILALRGGRHNYISSPFRTMLIADISERQNASGFAKLFEFETETWKNDFIASYKETLSHILNDREKTTSYVYDYLTTYSSFRYLVRSTPFYTKLKEVIGHAFYLGEDYSFIFDFCSDLHKHESTLYPELDTCILRDTEKLLRGITPYWSLDGISGDLSEGASNARVTTIDTPPYEWLSNNIARIEGYGIENYCSDIENSVHNLYK